MTVCTAEQWGKKFFHARIIVYIDIKNKTKLVPYSHYL